MQINYMTLIMNWINFGLIIGIYKGVNAFKSFIKKNKQMNEKLDIILDTIEESKK
ncbi:uncharacterized protein YneF (UPF0154 family) [Clostridium beijerinckii]|uniref:hypothetical protein n=1 Tax=Clostridium beijerinckii TaxID=1520 RepID=UPI001494129A|nr:hypothetical protein [Clostridium beijerinckii]NOW83974.1 uncharacterized protein YneF (UPF0154 family) [Clostridium beijerinckii]